MKVSIDTAQVYPTVAILQQIYKWDKSAKMIVALNEGELSVYFEVNSATLSVTLPIKCSDTDERAYSIRNPEPFINFLKNYCKKQTGELILVIESGGMFFETGEETILISEVGFYDKISRPVYKEKYNIVASASDFFDAIGRFNSFFVHSRLPEACILLVTNDEGAFVMFQDKYILGVVDIHACYHERNSISAAIPVSVWSKIAHLLTAIHLANWHEVYIAYENSELLIQSGIMGIRVPANKVEIPDDFKRLKKFQFNHDALIRTAPLLNAVRAAQAFCGHEDFQLVIFTDKEVSQIQIAASVLSGDITISVRADDIKTWFELSISGDKALAILNSLYASGVSEFYCTVCDNQKLLIWDDDLKLRYFYPIRFEETQK